MGVGESVPLIEKRGFAFLGRENTKGKATVMLFFVAAFLLSVSFFVIRYPVSTAFFFSLGSAYSLLLLYGLISFCLFQHRDTPFGRGSSRLLLFAIGVALCSALLMESLTLCGAPVSTPFEVSDWSIKRILVFFIGALSIEVYVLFLREGHGSAAISLSSFSREYWRERRFLNSIPVVCFVVLLCVLFYLFVSTLFSMLLGEGVGRFVFFFLCGVSSVLVVVFALRDSAARPEIMFLALCLFSGSVLVFCLPPVTAISWDDEIHYDRALGLSYLGHAEISDADRLLVHKPWAAVDLDFDLVRQAVEEVALAEPGSDNAEAYSDVFGFATPVRGVSLADVSTIGYFPSAIALWLARLFHAPILLAVVLGRLGNLISYALVIATAIRIAPVRKGVIIAIGLLPTSVFLASSFSYDPVVISFLLLSVALIMRELHAPDVKLSKTGMLAICAALFVGLAPKAIYFPVIGLLLLMPSSKFNSTGSYKKYIGLVVAFGLLMVSSFVLPMLFSASTQAGDARGGTDVSAVGQIAFILSNPLEYLQILSSFMLNYLSPVSSDMYTLSYAYMGFLPALMPWLSSFGFLLLSLTVALDIQSDPFPKLKLARIWTAVLFVSSVALVCTSLYVSFTPVGLPTIQGVQLRYLTPVLFTASLCVPSFGSALSAQKNEDIFTSRSVFRASILFPCISMLLLLTACSWCLALAW